MKRNSLAKRVRENLKKILIEFETSRDPSLEPAQSLALFVFKKITELNIQKHIKSINFINNKIIIKLKNKKPPK